MSLLLQATLSVANENLAEAVPVEKTLSIIELITSGGLGADHYDRFISDVFFALYLYFERLMAINAASHIDSNFMSQIRDNIRNGRIDNAKIACAH
jgi:biopolymer transport protein ExbB